MRFLEAQGFPMLSILYQDNTAAIQLEKFGKKSCSRRTRHFDIRFFNVKDKLKENNINVVYCPTAEMVADFLQNPFKPHNSDDCDVSSWGWTLSQVST